MQIKKIYIKSLFFIILIAPPLCAMELKIVKNDILTLPRETFLHICTTQQGKEPWKELGRVLQLRRICTEWKALLSRDHRELADRLHIPLMHYFSAMGIPDAIMGLKGMGHSVREPDENGFSPSDYAIGMKQQKSINILQLGRALKPHQIPNITSDPVIPESEYTLQDITDALQNDQPEQLTTILINVLPNPDKGVPMLSTIDWKRAASWAERCRHRLVYALQCDIENTLFEKIDSGEDFPEYFFGAFNTMCANPNAYNFKGFTPLHKACSLPGRLSVVESLLKCDGIDVNYPSKEVNTRGITPLHLIAELNKSKTLKALLDTKKCNVNAFHKQYGTPLHCAAAGNNKTNVRLLIDNKADVYSRNPHCCNATPLHIAAEHKNTDALAPFFETSGCPIDINNEDEEGRTPLWYAVGENSSDCMQYLLYKNADIAGMTKDRARNLLQYAVIRKSTQCFPTLLARLGHTIHHTDKRGQGVMHCAAMSGIADFIQPLVEARASVSLPDINGDTPLHYAAYQGHNNVILELCKYDADLNAYNVKGFTPLHDVCSLPQRASTVAFLLTCDGIDANCLTKHSKEEGMTPLHLTANWNNVEALKLLLSSEQCTTVNACNKKQGTPLHVATAKNHTACVRLLIDHKADIYSKIKDNSNVTPLHYAAQHPTPDALAPFFETSECALDIDIKDGMGHTPLWHAVGSDSFACMKYLLDRNAYSTGVTKTRGKTLLQYAITEKSIQCFPTLLARLGHTINHADKCGQGAVHWAAKSGHAGFIEPLVSAGALVNAPDLSGDTAMSYAASRGHIDVILELVKYGADVNSACNADRHFDDTTEHAGNFTPLHYAARNGHLEAVKTLVQQCNADTAAKTQLGKTAVDIAKERGHSAIVDFLTGNT